MDKNALLSDNIWWAKRVLFMTLRVCERPIDANIHRDRAGRTDRPGSGNLSA